jgi:hypothetical protein
MTNTVQQQNIYLMTYLHLAELVHHIYLDKLQYQQGGKVINLNLNEGIPNKTVFYV